MRAAATTLHPDAGVQARGIRPSGFRLPDRTQLGRVRLQVSELERSLDWYVGLLGFQVATREAGVATLAAADGNAVVELHERAGARAVPPRGRLGLFHFAILLPDRVALGRFVAHLAAAGAPAGMSDHLVSEAIYLSDPDGLGIEVYADRPRESWRWAGSELQMDTRPLDVRALAAAGGGTPWSGMPAGTRIGHVHLHVGEIDRAAAFYHDALGFDVTVRGYPGALFLSAGGYHHHLGVNTWAAGAPPASEEDVRLLDWELRLPAASDVTAAVASLRAAGARVVPDEAAGGWRAADPWGTSVRITG